MKLCFKNVPMVPPVFTNFNFQFHFKRNAETIAVANICRKSLFLFLLSRATVSLLLYSTSLAVTSTRLGCCQRRVPRPQTKKWWPSSTASFIRGRPECLFDLDCSFIHLYALTHSFKSPDTLNVVDYLFSSPVCCIIHEVSSVGTLLLFSKCFFMKPPATVWESERSGGK